MTTMLHIKAKLVPWDDPDFVRAFERARAETADAGFQDGPRAAERVQHLLRDTGYRAARVEVRQTVEETLEHVTHWSVSRDG